jgi:hypothetical protein
VSWRESSDDSSVGGELSGFKIEFDTFLGSDKVVSGRAVCEIDQADRDFSVNLVFLAARSTMVVVMSMSSRRLLLAVFERWAMSVFFPSSSRRARTVTVFVRIVFVVRVRRTSARSRFLVVFVVSVQCRISEG